MGKAQLALYHHAEGGWEVPIRDERGSGAFLEWDALEERGAEGSAVWVHDVHLLVLFG